MEQQANEQRMDILFPDEIEAMRQQEETPQQSPRVASIIEDAKEFARVDMRLKDLKAKVKELEEEKKAISQRFVDTVAEEGLQSVNVSIEDDHGRKINRTVYLKREVFASPEVDRPSLAEALEQCGYGELVAKNYNANSFSAVVREFDPENNMPLEDIRAKLPEGLQPHVKLSERYSTQSCKAKTKKR